MGIFIVFILQSTWFVAWMSIDQARIDANRNGCLPCYKHPLSRGNPENKTKMDEIAQECSQMDALQSAFHQYGKILLKPVAQAVVISITIGVLAISLWGNVELRQEFDPIWFLPRDSYLARWNYMNER